MKPLAIVCPSRGRPHACWLMIESALKHSQADILIYLDQDDESPYEVHPNPRVKTSTGSPMGRGAAINALCDQFRGYRAYLLVSDDVTFVRSGWESEILQALDAFQEIGLVHLESENGFHHVNWPCVSRKWIDTLGWMNPPSLKWYCQDTVLSCLGEGLNRVHRIRPKVLHHHAISGPSAEARADEDVWRFLEYMAKDFGRDLSLLRDACLRS